MMGNVRFPMHKANTRITQKCVDTFSTDNNAKTVTAANTRTCCCWKSDEYRCEVTLSRGISACDTATCEEITLNILEIWVGTDKLAVGRFRAALCTLLAKYR